MSDYQNSTYFKTFMKSLYKALPLAFLTGSLLHFSAAAQKVNRKTTESLLAKVDSAAMVDYSFTFSNDMTRIGYRIKKKDRQMIVINNMLGTPYNNVSLPVFSPDGKRFFYHAIKGTKSVWVFGDVKELKIDSVSPIVNMRYAPDSKSLLYIMAKDGKFYTSFNNNTGKMYDAIDMNSIAFSKDGSKIAYSAKLNNRQLNVYDGKEGAIYDQVGFPVLSADGNHIGYWAINGGKWYAIIDGQQGQPFEEVTDILFSDNGSHYAYHAKLSQKDVAVYDGKVGEKYSRIHSMLLSGDGAKLAYMFYADKKDAAGFDQFVYYDGQKLGAYETVVQNSLKFGPDNKTLAFEAEIHDEFFMVVDGKNGRKFGDVLQAVTAFSPDNSRFAYAVENETKRFVVESGSAESYHFQDVYFVSFSPDNKKLLYTARNANKDMVFVDGNAGRTYDAILNQGQVTFDGANAFHYMAMKGSSIVLVKET